MNKLFFAFLFLISCSHKQEKGQKTDSKPTQPYTLVLGTAQDVGYPQITCQKERCKTCL